jgi:hypothetical protein
MGVTVAYRGQLDDLASTEDHLLDFALGVRE